MGNLDEHDLVNEIGRAVRNYTREDFGAATVFVATKNLFARVEAKGDGSVSVSYDVPLPLTIKSVAACGHAQAEPAEEPPSPQSDEEGAVHVTPEQIAAARQVVVEGSKPTGSQEAAITRLNDEYGVKTWGWVGPEEGAGDLSLIVTLDDGRRIYVAKDGVTSPVHDIR